LLDFGEIIDGISVQLDGSDLDDGEVFVLPDLGAVKGKGQLVSVVLLHDLNGQLVSRKVASVDGLSKISSQEASILTRDELGFFIGHSLLAQFRNDVESDPSSDVLLVDEAEGVGSPGVHGSEAEGCSNGVREDHEGSVEGLGILTGVVPQGRGVVEGGPWVSLPGVNAVGAGLGISADEDGEIDHEEVPVSFFSVKLDGESSDISLDIWITLLDESSGESGKDLSLLSHLREELGLADIADVVGDSECSMGSISQGVDISCRDLLSDKLCRLLHESEVVLVQNGTQWSCCQRHFGLAKSEWAS